MPKKAKNPSLFIILFILSVAVNFFLGIKFLFPRSKTKTPSEARGTVSRIIDGDTFDLSDDTRIRVSDIDAPEYPKGCLSAESKNRLSELILGKTVTLKNQKPDNFQRTLAQVSLDNLNIAHTLVTEGLASTQESSDPALLSLEEQAQQASRGIWSSKCQAPPDPKCIIKGNVRRDRGTKVYHLPTCYNYKKIVINQTDGDQWFCSESDAQSAGFTPSADCPENKY